MATIPVIVKHLGKRYNVDLDTSSTGETFKFQMYSLTGVEPERQKILVKGGQLKDDTDLSKIGAKAGQTFMMMGTPASGEGSAALEPPKEKTRFLEDMTEAEAARVEGATPAGLQNLGNTCYMNATLQLLRSVPELQKELSTYSSSSASSSMSNLSQYGLGGLGATGDLTASLRDLYKQMSQTQEGFPPLMFLNALRTAFPQFAQKAKNGHGYAQQDAEEAWSQIIFQLRDKLKVKETVDSEGGKSMEVTFVDKYMGGIFETIMECDEPEAKEAGEEPIKGEETFLKLNVNIKADTNHLREGVWAALKEDIEKTSAVLGRNATYTKTSRIARLPKYLPVHFMRFGWRKDTKMKTKILRKVTFPHEFDVVEFCTDDLKKMLVPVRDKVREVRKEELDVERARKRQKRMEKAEEKDFNREIKANGPASEAQMALEKQAGQKIPPKNPKTSGTSTSGGADTEMPDITYKTDAEIELERASSILSAKKELLELVDAKLAADTAANQTGLYELRGVVTHQGSTADSGHYTAYVKKEGPIDPLTGKKEEGDKWWWFNDDRVTEVEPEKIDTLSGGGESHSALILLYRAVELPTTEELKKLEELQTSGIVN